LSSFSSVVFPDYFAVIEALWHYQLSFSELLPSKDWSDAELYQTKMLDWLKCQFMVHVSLFLTYLVYARISFLDACQAVLFWLLLGSIIKTHRCHTCHKLSIRLQSLHALNESHWTEICFRAVVCVAKTRDARYIGHHVSIGQYMFIFKGALRNISY